jgi:hypothetical protein
VYDVSSEKIPTDPLDEAPVAGDFVRPFLLEVPGLLGRLVRLGPVVDTVLTRHDYPEPVARLLGEFLALAGTLSSLLKYEGTFTLQTKGDGPVRAGGLPGSRVGSAAATWPSPSTWRRMANATKVSSSYPATVWPTASTITSASPSS